MAESSILPKSIAATLKCGQCKEYLSVLPVLMQLSGDYLCGRCTPKTDKNLMIKASAYENLAKTVLFPCIHDSKGCSRYLNVDETKEHELACEFRTINCPALACKIKIKVIDILNHFHNFHREHIIKTEDITIPCQQNFLANKLIIIDNKLYILEMCMITEDREFLVGLHSLQQNKQKTLYQLEVISENSNTLVLKQRLVNEYCPAVNFIKSEMVSIDFELVKSVLKSENIKFAIKLLFPEEHDDNKKGPIKQNSLLEELECIVCKDYMLPPIYICKTGHSLCSSCKKSIQDCPICKEKYEGARNFALEKLTEHVNYPCKNQSKGCNYVGLVQNIRTHEAKCSASKIQCPLTHYEFCHWKGSLHEVYNHYRRAHPHRLWFRLNQNVYRNLKTKFLEDCYLVTCDNNIFKFCLLQDNDEPSMSFVMKHVDLLPGEKPKYQFILSFVDQTGTNRILSLNELCYGEQNGLFHNCIKLPQYLLKPFIHNDFKLVYTVNIVKIK